MGNSCVTPSRSVAPQDASPAPPPFTAPVPDAPSPAAAPIAHKPEAQGLAESRDVGAITPRQVHVSSSKSKQSSGWVMADADSIEDGVKVEKSGRSIARRPSKEIEDGTPQEALQDLMDGNARFMAGESDHPHQTFTRLQTIAPKQKPIAAILACADSRVPVELLFDQGFGDVFVCRIAGNIATAEEIASLEYAVLELGVRVIMVMGHTSCGAVKAALSGKAFPGFIDALVDHLDVAVVRAQSRNATAYSDLMAAQHKGSPPDSSLIELVIRENAMYQVARCKRSTIILEAYKKGKLIVVPAVYDIKTGEVQIIK